VNEKENSLFISTTNGVFALTGEGEMGTTGQCEPPLHYEHQRV
jgi:hypothetical protein